MAIELLKFCAGCGEYFHYYDGHGVQVKKRGYSARYYCPRCIANTKSNQKEATK